MEVSIRQSGYVCAELINGFPISDALLLDLGFENGQYRGHSQIRIPRNGFAIRFSQGDFLYWGKWRRGE